MVRGTNSPSCICGISSAHEFALQQMMAAGGLSASVWLNTHGSHHDGWAILTAFVPLASVYSKAIITERLF